MKASRATWRARERSACGPSLPAAFWVAFVVGRRTRGRALVEAGAIGAKLVLGVFAMLIFAAFIEAYWSSIEWMPSPFKFGVGVVLWSAILLWLWRGGRGRSDVE